MTDRDVLGEIRITVVEAKDIGTSASISPYINLRITNTKSGTSTEKKRTIVGKGQHPAWENAVFAFHLYNFDEEILEFHIWDKLKVAANTSLGTASIAFDFDSQKHWESDLWVDVKGGNGKIHILLKYHAGKVGLHNCSLQEYEEYLNANDPQKLSHQSTLKGPHELVSLRKKRFCDGKYDLDLAYITDRIIAMGFPSDGMEKIYRNAMKHTQDFLNEYHPCNYKVYNLCSERSYAANKFFRYGMYPFADHNVPPVEVLHEFCIDAAAWLADGDDHIVAVHCKAGKGRTGLMICCLLMFMFGLSAHDAMAFYGRRRTHNAKGVTIPSQIRWINAYATLKDLMRAGTWDPHRPLRIVEVKMTPLSNVFQPDITIECPSQKVIFNSKEYKGKPRSKQCMEPFVFDLSQANLFVNKETRITCHDLASKEKKPAYWTWFHTRLCPEGFVWVFKHNEVDKLKKGIDDFVLTISFEDSPHHFKARHSLVESVGTAVTSPTKAEQPYEKNAHTEPNEESSESSELEAEDKKKDGKELAGPDAPTTSHHANTKRETAGEGSLSSSPPNQGSNLPTTPRGESKPLPTIPPRSNFTRSLTQEKDEKEKDTKERERAVTGGTPSSPVLANSGLQHRVSEPRPSSIKIGEKVASRRDITEGEEGAKDPASAKCPTLPPIPLSPRDRERLEREKAEAELQQQQQNGGANNHNGQHNNNDANGDADKPRALLSLFDEPPADLSPRSEEERLKQKQSASFKDFEKRLMKRESSKKRSDFKVNSNARLRDSENGDGTGEFATVNQTQDADNDTT